MICQFALNGHLDIEVNGESKRIGITRIHMEEDAGNSFIVATLFPIPNLLMLTTIVLV